MTAQLINTAVMPADDMAPDSIEAAATNFRSVGSKVSARGGTVVSDWEKIGAVYEAPESETLVQAMDPVQTKAEGFGADMTAAAKALDTFADVVRTIKAEVARIRTDAAAFLGGIEDGKISKVYYGGGDYYTGDFDWHTDQASIDANNALIARAHAQQEALEAAERVCASAIRAAVGLGPVLPRSAANPNGYGSTDIPDDVPMPWGAAGGRTEGCLERAGNGVVIDGAGGLLADAGSILGFSYTDDEGLDWSLSTTGDALQGMGMFAVGALTMATIPGLIASRTMPGPVGTFLRDSQFMVPATVAGLGAIDLYNQNPWHKWRDDPARAGGETLFNLVTLPLAALKITKLGRLGRAVPDAPEGDASSPRTSQGEPGAARDVPDDQTDGGPEDRTQEPDDIDSGDDESAADSTTQPDGSDLAASNAQVPPAARVDVEDAIARAAAGQVRFPGHDGKPYLNLDGSLPTGARYTEWTAAPAGSKRGPHRVLVAGDPARPDAIYYWDHVNPPVRIGP